MKNEKVGLYEFITHFKLETLFNFSFLIYNF